MRALQTVKPRVLVAARVGAGQLPLRPLLCCPEADFLLMSVSFVPALEPSCTTVLSELPFGNRKKELSNKKT